MSAPLRGRLKPTLRVSRRDDDPTTKQARRLLYDRRQAKAYPTAEAYPTLARRQLVAEFVALGVEIAGVVGVGGGDDGDLVEDLKVEAVVDEGVDLFGVVSEQADLAEAEVFENLDADAVVAHVGLVAEGLVGFDGVEAFFL